MGSCCTRPRCPGGRLGEEAYRFVDWLAAAGQSWWQVLPLGPPDASGSPYNAASAFAGSPALLAEPRARVTTDDVEEFAARHPFWADDWAAFAGRGALADQVRFEREWSALRDYARKRNVRIFGDIPIYVAAGSAEHLAHPELFSTGEVAGAPPDVIRATGQHWGNPLYDWRAHRATGYRWWIERFRRDVRARRHDAPRPLPRLRLVLGDSGVAQDGAARALAARARAPSSFGRSPTRSATLPLVAEDLGVITPAVVRLRDELGLPGTVVLQWAFDSPPSSPHRLENHERAVRRLHVDARHRHRARLVRIAAEARARDDRTRSRARPPGA